MICDKHGPCSTFCRACDLDTIAEEIVRLTLNPETVVDENLNKLIPVIHNEESTDA